MRYATPDVKMSVMEIRWGLVPDVAARDLYVSLDAEITLPVPFETVIRGAITDISEGGVYVELLQKLEDMIGDLSNFRVETTDLSERDITGVNVGQTASVTVKALNQTFTGKVVDVARVSTTVGGDVVYKVTIALDSQPQGLRWGMTTDVAIQTGN